MKWNVAWQKVSQARHPGFRINVYSNEAVGHIRATLALWFPVQRSPVSGGINERSSV